MSPDGHVSGTETFYHLQFFLSNPEACPAVFALLADKWEDFEEKTQAEYRSGERRWHEWVDVPMDVEDDLAMEAKNVAYREGWGRIGSFGGDKLELECFDEHRAKLSRRTRKLAEMLGRELVVTVREPLEPPTPSP